MRRVPSRSRASSFSFPQLPSRQAVQFSKRSKLVWPRAICQVAKLTWHITSVVSTTVISASRRYCTGARMTEAPGARLSPLRDFTDGHRRHRLPESDSFSDRDLAQMGEAPEAGDRVPPRGAVTDSMTPYNGPSIGSTVRMLAQATLSEPGLLLTRFMSFELACASERLSNLVEERTRFGAIHARASVSNVRTGEELAPDRSIRPML
jgi:hypothetical protein